MHDNQRGAGGRHDVRQAGIPVETADVVDHRRSGGKGGTRHGGLGGINRYRNPQPPHQRLQDRHHPIALNLR